MDHRPRASTDHTLLTGHAYRCPAWSTRGGYPVCKMQVDSLWTPLWDAYRRGIAHWWKEGYDHHEQTEHEPLARRMIEIALEGDRELVKGFIKTLPTNSGSLHMLFDGFATVFTYHDDSRTSMPDF